MYKKMYKEPAFAVTEYKFDVIVMSGTGNDSDGFDNEMTGINWTGGGLGL